MLTKSIPWVYQVCFSDSLQASRLAKYVYHQLHFKDVALLLDADSPYSQTMGTLFQKFFIAEKGKVSLRQDFFEKDEHFSSYLKKIQRSSAQAVFLPAFAHHASKILNTAKELSFTKKFFGADTWDNQEFIQLAGKALVGSVFASHYKKGVTHPFSLKYLNFYHKPLDAYGALSYDALLYIQKSLSIGGLNNVRSFTGITGKFTYPVGQRTPIKDITFQTVTEGNRG